MSAGPAPKRGLQRAMLTICAMTATIMQALDTTVANVALPYMQGSLSASLDQVNWILTSYIVASAIMTAPVGWLAGRYGRKVLFIVCTTGFTIASLLCGLAGSIEQMVAFRLLQGMCGAGLIPLSQAVMLDSYTIEERGQAMAIWGMGIMLGPIMGPTLGGWLTETYNWRWVFLINMPIGIITVIGLLIFMDETDTRREMRFDWLGFIALAVGIGALQLMVDRGEQLGWFGSTEIQIELIVAIAGFYYFFAHSLTTPEPFVRFELFRDRNFLGGCLFMVILGMTVFATMTLSALFLQLVLGYPVMSAGMMLAARGLGTMVGMLGVGRLLRVVEARTLIFVGMILTAGTMYQLVYFTNMTPPSTIISVTVVQGLGLGLVFVPLSTAAFATLPATLRTDGTAILDSGAQHRLLGRHSGGRGDAGELDLGHARAARRTHHTLQRCAAGTGRACHHRPRNRHGARLDRQSADPAGSDHRLRQQLQIVDDPGDHFHTIPADHRKIRPAARRRAS